MVGANNVVGFSFSSRDELREAYHQYLRFGGGFAAGRFEVGPGDRCDVVIVCPGGSLRMAAVAVCVIADGPAAGVGVEFSPFGKTERRDLADLAGVRETVDEDKLDPAEAIKIHTSELEADFAEAGQTEAAQQVAQAAARLIADRAADEETSVAEPDSEQSTANAPASEVSLTLLEADDDTHSESNGSDEARLADRNSDDGAVDQDDSGRAADQDDSDASADTDDGNDGGDEEVDRNEKRLALNPMERVRKMTPPERRKVALRGEVSDRVALERVYGKEVWELLLRNPKLTIPEVVRISRMGSLPRPLVETICQNTRWVQSPQVRRALLSNPKLTKSLIKRILRTTPKRELKLVPMQTAYPVAVRDEARRMLRATGR